MPDAGRRRVGRLRLHMTASFHMQQGYADGDTWFVVEGARLDRVVCAGKIWNCTSGVANSGRERTKAPIGKVAMVSAPLRPKRYFNPSPIARNPFVFSFRVMVFWMRQRIRTTIFAGWRPHRAIHGSLECQARRAGPDRRRRRVPAIAEN